MGRTLILLLALGPAGLAAQPSFRSGVDLVTVPVHVTTRDGAIAGKLGPADFHVYEDGVRQELTLVSHEPRALSLCILLDSSPSMASVRQRLAIRAIDTLLAGLREDDEAALLFFASRPRMVIPWTRAAELPAVEWIEWRLALGTALIDAVREGLRQVEGATNPRPVIVLVSDGGENASGTTLASLAGSRRQSETMIYGIQTDSAPSRFAPSVNRAFANFLPEVVGPSGGAVFRAQHPDGAEAAARRLLEELRAQYTLGYVPKRAPDGGYRTIKIEPVSTALTVRHREGYLAAGGR